MCKRGDEVVLMVPIPAELSSTGKFRWDKKAIDRCIAPIVQALNDAEIYTAGCCCGHGKSDGSIILHDGRELIVRTHLTKRAPDLGDARRKWEDTPGQFESGDEDLFKPAPSG